MKTGEVIGIRCGSWRCDTCSVSNGRAFRKRLHLGLEADETGEVPKLLTLTSPPGEAPWQSRDRLTRRFEYLRTILARSYPAARLDGYVLVPELTRAGVIHAHVILRGVPFLPQAVWSRMAARAGFGYIVDIRRVRSHAGMGRYLGKAMGRYLTKQAGSASWPPHFRRIRFSRAWAPSWAARARRAPQDGSEWQLHRVLSLEEWRREVAAALVGGRDPC